MKIIYSWGTDEKTAPFIETSIKEWRGAGYHVTSINQAREMGEYRVLSPDELNRLYQNKDKKLFDLYDKIRRLSREYDVFIVNYYNVYHPEFIKSLTGIYTVIASGDDPESSDSCSKPYVRFFDHSFAWGVNFDSATRITEKFLEWGAKRADWWPYGVREDMYNPRLTEEDILKKERDIDLVFVGGPYSKVDRLLKIEKAFPQMKIYGHGWHWRTFIRSRNKIATLLAGFWRVKNISNDELISIYQRSKIGINIHLSFGPSNLRTYQLPANGVMEICDCKDGLSQVYGIDKEVIAYNSIDEAIELIKYYLEHDEERKKIAVAGFRKTLRNYKRSQTIANAVEKIKKGMAADWIKYFKDGTPVI